MNNEPVAWMERKINLLTGESIYSFKKAQPEIGDIPLYTHPVKELNNGGEPVKNATYWKRQYNLMASQNDNLKSGLYHANEQIKYLESHPVKEQLTDEEIEECYWGDGYPDNPRHPKEFARAILRKAQEK